MMADVPAPPATLYGLEIGIPIHDRRILIADTSAFNRKTLARFLKWAGLSEIAFIDDGADTFARIETTVPDLVILSTDIPGLDPLDICRRLRAHPILHDIPVLIQTTDRNDHLRTLCFQAGATDVISKPINPGECIARVRYHLERRSLVQELRAFRERVERDLRMAGAMQMALVPEPPVLSAVAERLGITIAAEFQSSDEVGGDFWTLFDLGPTRAGIFVADLAGHGIPAAINAFRLHTLLTRLTESEPPEPDRLLYRLNNGLHAVLPIGQYATGIYAVLDTAADTLCYAGAGAPNPILGHGRSFGFLDASGIYLGPFPDEAYQAITVPFPPGSWLFLYSDVVTESRDADDAMLGEKGLRDLIAEVLATSDGVDAEVPASQRLEALLTRFRQRYGNKPTDDLTAIWITRPGAGG